MTRPIRIYAETTVGTRDYFVWDTNASCTGGYGGCNSCYFYSKEFSCATIINRTVAAYKPTVDYVELSILTNPEVFL